MNLNAAGAFSIKLDKLIQVVLFGLMIINPVLAVPADEKYPGEIKVLGSGLTPCIAVDSTGACHVVYGSDDGLVYVRGDSTGVFEDPETIPVPPDGPGRYGFPEIAIDKNNQPHVVFQLNATSRSKKGWYTNRAGGSWKNPLEFVHHPDTRVNNPRLALFDDTVIVGVFGAQPGNSSTIVRIVNVHSNPSLEKLVYSELWVATPISDSNGKLYVAGRDGAQGHFIQEYDTNLERLGKKSKVSESVKDGLFIKTGEASGCMRGRDDVIHFSGVAGMREVPGGEYTHDVIWYNNTSRMENGGELIPGLTQAYGTDEFVYPNLAEDIKGNIYIAYRDFISGEGRVAVVKSGGIISEPTAFTSQESAPVKMLRYNPHIASSNSGAVHVVWQSTDGKVYFRSIAQ